MYSVKFVQRKTGRTRLFEAVEVDAKPITKAFATQDSVRWCFHGNNEPKDKWAMEYHLYRENGTVQQVFAGPGTSVYVMGEDGKTLDSQRLNN